MAERIRRYQHNVEVIRASGCAVPTTAMIDSLDPAEIDLWFADNAFRFHRLENATELSRMAFRTADPEPTNIRSSPAPLVAGPVFGSAGWVPDDDLLGVVIAGGVSDVAVDAPELGGAQ
jgi:hypothetical protein